MEYVYIGIKRYLSPPPPGQFIVIRIPETTKGYLNFILLIYINYLR